MTKREREFRLAQLTKLNVQMFLIYDKGKNLLSQIQNNSHYTI